jgi:hypothetical protein
MDQYWPDPLTGSDTPELARERQKLVDRFNAVVGVRTPQELAFQAAFVLGEVSYDDAVSFVRFAGYMVSAGSRSKAYPRS